MRLFVSAALVVVLACGVLVFNMISVGSKPKSRRYWIDTAVAVRIYLDSVLPPHSGDAHAPLPEALGTSQRLVTRLGADVPSEQFWRILPIRPFMRNRADFVTPPDFEDAGRALVLARGYRLLGGVAPHLLQWLGVLAALPVLAWLIAELWWRGRPGAAAAVGLLVACSPYVVQSLSLGYSPFGFYLVALLALFALTSYCSLATSVSLTGLFSRSFLAGLVFSVCLLCRSGTVLLAPGFLLALGVAAGRMAGRSRRGRLSIMLAAVALFTLPSALSRRTEGHAVWAGFWEGLGDFDRSKGHFWKDEEAQRVLREAGQSAEWEDLSGAEAEAFFRRRVLADIRSDPAWYLAIVARRAGATVFQSKLWPWAPLDGTSFTPRASRNEGRTDQYYRFTTTIDFVGFGGHQLELPVVLIIAPSFLLACIGIAFRLHGNQPGQARFRQHATLIACPALGALGAPLLVTTASALETQAFVLVYFLGLGLCVDELLLDRPPWGLVPLVVAFCASALALQAYWSERAAPRISGKLPRNDRPSRIVSRDDGLFFPQPPDPSRAASLPSDDVVERLAALGYLTGYQKATTEAGVRTYSETLVSSGYNLFTSGHAPVALLMDLKGKILHEWRYDPREEPSIAEVRSQKMRTGLKYFRTVHLYSNGDLLALFDWGGIARIDKASQRLWFRSGAFHHDLDVQNDGTIYALDESETEASIQGRSVGILDNAIVVLSAEGQVRRAVSLWKCFQNSYPSNRVRELLEPATADLFHANSVDVIERDLGHLHPALKKGRVLVSLRTPSLLLVVDLETQRIALVLKGPWRHQHDARLQDDGRILLFDNEGEPQASRILELAPPNWDIAWSYSADPPTSFFSGVQGMVQRLPNGNVLVTESTRGRAFEVDRGQRIVWEFVSPYRAADDRELVAVLLDFQRIDKGFPIEWRTPQSPTGIVNQR